MHDLSLGAAAPQLAQVASPADGLRPLPTLCGSPRQCPKLAVDEKHQVIDGALNAAYAIFAVTEEEFAAIFPEAGQDVEFIEDVIARRGDTETSLLMEPIWERTVLKREVVGIHGTLFYELLAKKPYYENKREPVIHWRVVE